MPIRAQFETEAEWLDHIRIWMAGQALPGLCGWVTSTEEIARHCYRLADAMLAESKKGRE